MRIKCCAPPASENGRKPPRKKINVIKAVRSLTSLGLKEAKDLVEKAPDAIILMDVSLEIAESAKTDLEAKGATIELVGDVQEVEVTYTDSTNEDADDLYNVVITEVGTQKINVIKAVRSLTSLGLVEAKDIVEKVPDAIVLMDVSLDVAEVAKIELEAVGATVTVEALP